MKSKLKFIITVFALLVFPKINFGQSPPLGTAAKWSLFSTAGAVTNTGTGFLTKITGNVGTVAGAITGFGNVDGVMTFAGHADNAACAADILLTYNFLNVAPSTNAPGILLGNGQVLNAGVHTLPSASTMNGVLTLDAQGNANAIFIFQIQGPFATNTNSKVKLINGAQACNVYWKVEGAVSMATGTTMRGTVIANNDAITMNVGDTLEGRALAINGAILVSEILAYTPIGCGSAVLTGPVAPTFGASACYAIFSSIGALGNTPVSNITGDVGNAGGALAGWTAAEVTGTLHPTGDGSTMAAAADLGNVNSYLLALPFDIELLFPPQFGHNLVLTPHTYLLNSATALTDTVYLNGMGDPNAVFVIQVMGAFTAGSGSRVVLTNGTQAKNVYWKINGAVDIGVNSIFNGTMIVDGAFLLQPGVVINGRALTINGAITTTAVTVTIPSSITINAGAVNDTTCVGGSASFSINANGVGLLYQWRKGITNLVDGGNISGSQTATLIINPVSLLDAATDYNVVVTDGGCGGSFTSADAALVISSPAAITVEPISQITGCAGGLVNFSVTATGSNLTYQWRNGNVNLINGGNISGATTATLTINPANISDTSSFYNVVIIDGSNCAQNDTSVFVSLMLGNPLIVSEPLSQSACAGNSISFSVTATGSALTYQWRKGTVNLLNGGNISGATTATLTINPVSITDTSSFYNVVVTGGCSPNDTSINVSLQLNGPIIISEPLSQTACSGNSISFSVTATGSALTYQWRKGIVDLIDGATISGATTATLTINPALISDTSSFYNVVIIGGCAPNDTSINVSLFIKTAPLIVLEPISQLSCIGNSNMFSITATGTNLTYQWMNGNTNVINSGTISGAQTATLTISPLSISDTSSNYYVVVSGDCSPNDTSMHVSLTTDSPIITSEPVSQAICSGNSVSFSVTATGSFLNYQWRNGNVNLVDGGNISGATTATLTINPAAISDTSSFYNVVIIGACSPNDTSNFVSLNIGGSIITTEPINEAVCLGSSATFSVSATGTGVLNYQWRKVNSNVIDGGNITGAQTATLTINPAGISDTSSFYYVVVTGGCSPNDTSLFVSLDVNLIPSVVAASNSPVCTGTSLNLSVPAVALATYSWTGPNGFTSSSQNPVIALATLVDAGVYTLIVTANTCSSLPSSVTVVVNSCLGTADLSVIKSVDIAQPFIGHNVVFTIIATNNGTANATGVIVTDVLQNGYVYVSSSTSTGLYDSSTGVWTIGNLANGASVSLSITATVIADGNYVNNALVQGNEVDPNFTNNFSSVETFPTDFNIPEGFSPNGDGINDLFVIRGIGNFPANEFTIFNRWGNKVFEASPYKNEWNGKAQMGIRVGGDDLPVGTYFYLLDLKDGTPVYKGTIYLNK